MRKILALFMVTQSLVAFGNVIQFLGGLSFNNTALLAQVKDSEFIIGSSVLFNRLEFNGTQLDLRNFQYPYGTSNVNTVSNLPFGRLAQRFNKEWVFAVDVTTPFHSNLDWGKRTVGRYAAAHTLLRDYDVSPKLAFQFNEKLQIGAGVNINFLENNEGNWVLPTPVGDRLLVNQSSNVGYGFNLGFNYLISPMDQLGFVYYSRIKQRSEGTSTLGPLVNDNFQFFFNMPETMVLSYLHIFNQKWLANIQIIRTSWNINQYITFRNTAAGDFTFNMSFKRATAVLGVLRRQLNDKWAFSLFGMMDDGPENDRLRTLNFPSDVQYIGALSAEYFIKPSVMVQVLGGALYSKTRINNQIPSPITGQMIPFTSGRVHIAAPFIEARLKISR